MADTAQKTVKSKRKPVHERRRNVDRSATTQGQILAATVLALRELGYGAVTNNVVAERAGVSRGAMMHHYPLRKQLLVATIEFASAKLMEYRKRELDRADPGLPRFRLLTDLAFATAGSPEGLAINEIRNGARSDPDIATAVTPMMSQIADDFGRFLGKQVRAAGLSPDQEMQGFLATVAMTARALTVDGFTHPNRQMQKNVLSALKLQRERIVERQLGSQTVQS